jgi:hypothetical protein
LTQAERSGTLRACPEDPRYHIKLEPGQVGGYVLLPGDRDRVQRIAKHLRDARTSAENREYRTTTGDLDGTKVSVVSSGMGSPVVAIAVEELRTAGVHTIIRTAPRAPWRDRAWRRHHRARRGAHRGHVARLRGSRYRRSPT